MINVNALNQAINALKAETQRDAITPIYLGNLLQRISDLLATATTESDIAVITQLQIALNNLKQKVNAYVINLQNDPTYISYLQQGANDRNNVYLNATKVNVAYGTASTIEQAVTIKQATSERAGVMRAQQVTDLNNAKSDITALNTAMSNANSTIAELQSAVEQLQQTLPVHFQIECKSNHQDGLHVVGANRLVQMGYVPYIFRYSRKKSRYRHNRTERRRKGPKMRGWHIYSGVDKIRFDVKDILLICPADGNGDLIRNYSRQPKTLFHAENPIYVDGELKYIHLSYGSDRYDVKVKGHRFKFAVAFSKPQTGSRFDFSKLVTNLAEFSVYAYVQLNARSVDYHFAR